MTKKNKKKQYILVVHKATQTLVVIHKWRMIKQHGKLKWFNHNGMLDCTFYCTALTVTFQLLVVTFHSIALTQLLIVTFHCIALSLNVYLELTESLMVILSTVLHCHSC